MSTVSPEHYPVIEDPATGAAAPEFAEHARTYAGFVHILTWFAVHMLLLLGGLYVMTLGGSVAGGLLIMAFAVGILVYGLLSTAAPAH